MHLFSGYDPVRLVLSAVVVVYAIPAARLAQQLHHQWWPGEMPGTRAWLRQVRVLSMIDGTAMAAVVWLTGAWACTVNGFLWPVIMLRRRGSR